MTRRQCKACPWRRDVVAARDIPGGYDADKHRALSCTIAKPGEIRIAGTLRMMACHETPVGAERPCVGWLAHQLGPGNNIALRYHVLRVDRALADFELVGEQCESLDETLGEA